MKHILVLDIEATGLDADSSGLLELSAVRLSADLKNELAVFDQLVNPECEIPPFIERLTGIKNEMVTDAPSLTSVREEFAKFLQPDDIICGHNIQFDIGFLRAKGFDIPNDSLDTFSLAQIILPNEASYSLEILTEKYEIEHQNAHRALADVEANAELLRILVDEAGKFSTELLEKFEVILQKSAWIGSKIIQMGINAAKSAPKKTPNKAQLSIFDLAEPIKNNAPLAPEDPEDAVTERALSTLEQSTAEQIEIEMRSAGEVIFSLPMDTSQVLVASEAARRFVSRSGESTVVAMPQIYGRQTPSGFFRFTSPSNVICETEFRNWFAKKSSLDEADTIVALKFEREKFFGNSLALPDFPAIYSERQIVKTWLNSDHTRCKSDCPAKKIYLAAPSKKLFFCDYSDIALCPARHVILLKSDFLIKHVDSFSRERFQVAVLEKFLTRFTETHPEFTDGALFGIGLLKRFVREQVGESPYRKNLVFDESIIATPEINNLAEGFREVSRQLISLFPEALETAADFTALAALITEPPSENECRFATIAEDDELTFTRAPQSLQEKLDLMLANKETKAFLGNVFLKKGGRFIFGSDLAAPERQVNIASHFDFSRHAALYIPASGGNSKSADEQATVEVITTILPACDGNLLVLFPSSASGEKCITQIEQIATAQGFTIISASGGSTGKLRAQLAHSQKTILVASASNIKKIDFRSVDFVGCVQHRLFFDPPPDPAIAAQNASVSDEFLEYALPRAVQRFMQIFGYLYSSEKPFFWANLDAHFQRKGGFADEFLRALPASLPIEARPITEIPAEITNFLSSP